MQRTDIDQCFVNVQISICVCVCQSLIIQTASMDRAFGKQITNLSSQVDTLKPNMFSRIHSYANHTGSAMPKYNCNKHRESEVVVIKSASRENISTSYQDKTSLQTYQQRKKTNDIENIKEYQASCFKYMLLQQSKNYNLRNYILKQTQITAKMRGILLDWMIELHFKYKMCTQTLFATTMVIDKYISQKGARKDNLQLIGSAAFYLVAKFQQVSQVPRIDELVYYSDKAFTKNQLIQMETEILETLDYNLVTGTAHNFFSYLSKVFKLDQRNSHLGEYIIQLSLLQPRFLQYKPSHIAASSVYLISKINQMPQVRSSQLQETVGYSEYQLRQCAKDLCHLFQQADTHPNNRALHKKYSLKEYSEVTRIKLQRKKA